MTQNQHLIVVQISMGGTQPFIQHLSVLSSVCQGLYGKWSFISVNSTEIICAVDHKPMQIVLIFPMNKFHYLVCGAL